MKSPAIYFLVFLFLISCSTNLKKNDPQVYDFVEDSTDRTNDFYDNAPTYNLESTQAITVIGEINNPSRIDFSSLPLRSVLVKETLKKNQTDSFVGAYQYHGYSLYDILNHIQVDKANKDDFRPIIDLYVEVEGAAGEKTVISWGEIYYPENRHEILIATKVTPVIPSKTKDMWPIPQNSKLIVGKDLYTHRNISSPETISVRSLKSEYRVKQDIEKLYSPTIKLVRENGEQIATIDSFDTELNTHEYPTTFYGRGRGIHGVTTFKGVLLKQLVEEYLPLVPERIQNGMFTIAAPDGYRAAFSYSEVMNRNDQSEALVTDRGKGTADGRFRLFHSADFFSDRAIKSVAEVKLEILK